MPRLKAMIKGLPFQQTVLMRLGRALDQSMTTFLKKTISPFGMTEGSLHTLMILHCMSQDEVTPGLLCDLVAQTPANMTRILHTLESEGYITRKEDAKDGRKSKIAVSKSGSQLVRKTLPATIQPVQQALSGLTEAEMQQLEYLLRKTIASIDNATANLSI